MKILKIFGVVVGIHVFALLLIFASPGCSSTNKSAPAPSDTVINTDAPSSAPGSASSVADGAPVITAASSSPVVAVPASFDPNATAIDPVVRFSPTRPGTPAAGALETPPVADVTPATTYTATKGDSLWTIAKRHHITVAELASANNLKVGATVRLGQKLIIPGKSPTSAAATAADTSANKPAAAKPAATEPATPKRTSREAVAHVVKPGETLGGIARKYGVKVGEIATANNISDPAKIRPGMELTIPGWQAPGAKSPKAEPAMAPPVDPSPVEPAPTQDLDSGVKRSEAPVIQIDDPDAPTKA